MVWRWQETSQGLPASLGLSGVGLGLSENLAKVEVGASNGGPGSEGRTIEVTHETVLANRAVQFELVQLPNGHSREIGELLVFIFRHRMSTDSHQIPEGLEDVAAES